MSDGNDTARALFDRHYSRTRYADGRRPRLFVGPGEKLVAVTPDADAVVAWRKFISGDGQTGVNCAIFRNESPEKATTLLRSAMALAWDRWPGERLYTYVNPRKVRPTLVRGVPVFGWCFWRCGWSFVGVTQERGLWIWAIDGQGRAEP